MGFLWFGKKNNQKKIENQKPTLTPNDKFILGLYQNQAENDALKLSAVYSAISIISNTMSKLPFYIINRYTKERIEDDNLYNILNLSPNDKMNASVMNKMLWTWVLTSGEAYCIPEREFRSTKIKRLIPLSDEQVTNVLDVNDNLWYDVNLGEGKPIMRLRPDEIIHLKAMTLNGIDGVSPLAYARKTVQTGLNQEEFLRDFYENYARPLDYLETDANLSSVEKEVSEVQPDGTIKKVKKTLKQIFLDDWGKCHTGNNKFKTGVLDMGVRYKTVPQLSGEDMQFVESKNINVEDIARYFDMASCSFKLGVGKQTYSNNEQGQICYVTETIVPKLRQWETELTLKLLTDEQRAQGLVIKGNIEAELRGDTAARANWYDRMRSMGVYNINEIRAYEDLPSIGDNGETRLIGANSIPLERLLEGATAGSATPNDLSKKEESTDE